jgi:hypothetical protein
MCVCVCVYVRAYVPLERSVKTVQEGESGGGGNLQLESYSLSCTIKRRETTQSWTRATKDEKLFPEVLIESSETCGGASLHYKYICRIYYVYVCTQTNIVYN